MVVRRAKEEWAEIVRAFKNSEQTMTAFCEERGINVKTLGNHVYRERAGIEEPVKKRSLEEWSVLIDAQRNSGLGPAAWCRQNGITPDTMRTAARRLKENAGIINDTRWVELGGESKPVVPLVEKEEALLNTHTLRPSMHDKQTGGSRLESQESNGIRIRTGGLEIEADASYPVEKLSALIEGLVR